MYNFKEKSKILRELNNPAYGEADLNLLLRLNPGCKISSAVKNNPKKHSEEILFKLLDKATREEIRLNRRKFEGQDNDILDNDGTPAEPDKQDNDIPGNNGTPAEPDEQDNDIPGNDDGTPSGEEKKSDKKKTSTQKSSGTTSVKTETFKLQP